MAKRHSTPGSFTAVPLSTRFWTHVFKTDLCWLWTGARHRKYGKVRIYYDVRRSAEAGAHRVAWELENGRPVPDGLCVLHHCDTPLCVRPDHLFLGTRADNNADKLSKGRQSRGETHASAKLTKADVARVRALPLRRGDMARMAKALGVSHATLSLIRSGKNWKSGWRPPVQP